MSSSRHEDPVFPTGISPPLAVETDSDRSGPIVIVTTLLLSIALGAVGIRFYVGLRSRARIAGGDYALLSAVTFLCVESALAFLAVREGWGKSHRRHGRPLPESMLKPLYATDILYIVILYLTKCSAAVFFLRISPARGLRLCVRIVIFMSTTWALASVLLVALRCHLSRPWTDIAELCPDMPYRWKGVWIGDIVLEILIAGLSAFLVYDTSLSTRQKAAVVLAFSARLLTLIPSSLRLHYIFSSQLSSEPSLSGARITLATQAHLAVAMVANTIPCLRPFVAAYAYAYEDEGPGSGSASGSRRVSVLAGRGPGSGQVQSCWPGGDAYDCEGAGGGGGGGGGGSRTMTAADETTNAAGRGEREKAGDS